MYKLIYWSKQENKIKVIMFGYAADVANYFSDHINDIDLVDHFAKIVKE